MNDTVLGLLGIGLIVALYLLAMAYTRSETDPYDDEDDQW